jgi:hypothetical protein
MPAMFKLLLACMLIQFLQYPVQAQECNTYIPFVKGYRSETQMYRGNKKPNGKTILTIVDVQPTADSTVAIIEIKDFDPKGKPIGTGYYYNATCINGITKMDTRAAMGGPPNPKFTEGSCFTEFPADIQVDLALENCQFSSKEKGLYYEVQLYNRKFTSNEVVTVAAGTFNTFLIEYDMRTTMVQNKILNVVFEKHHKEWYAPGKGLVKSESYQPNKPYKSGDEPMFSSEMITAN